MPFYEQSIGQGKLLITKHLFLLSCSDPLKPPRYLTSSLAQNAIYISLINIFFLLFIPLFPRECSLLRVLGPCGVEFHLPNLHVSPKAFSTKPTWPSKHLHHQIGKHPQHGSSFGIHLQLQFPASSPFVTPGNFLDLLLTSNKYL